VEPFNFGEIRVNGLTRRKNSVGIGSIILTRVPDHDIVFMSEIQRTKGCGRKMNVYVNAAMAKVLLASVEAAIKNGRAYSAGAADCNVDLNEARRFTIRSSSAGRQFAGNRLIRIRAKSSRLSATPLPRKVAVLLITLYGIFLRGLIVTASVILPL
jgi:hypothetical protein